MPKNKSNTTKIRTIKPRKRRNVSSRIPNGQILQTRDEYFEGQGNYRKPGYESRGNYRKAVVVDSNRDDELAVVKGYSNGIDIGSKMIRKIKPFIETKDDANKPIKISEKFVKTNIVIPKKEVDTIKFECLKPKYKHINRKKLKKLKNRK